MYKVRYRIYYILMALAVIFEIKGLMKATPVWNYWSFISLIFFISTVIFAIKYDLRINPFRKTLERRKTQVNLIKSNQNVYSGKYKTRNNKFINSLALNSEHKCEQENKLNNGNPNQDLAQDYKETKSKDTTNVKFVKEILSYYDEPNEEQQKKLQDICNILNSFYRGLEVYKIEHFKMKSKYGPEKYQWINKEGDIWLYFMGCTDGTHAPDDFKETEWLAFFYKGIAVELNFEEQMTGPRTFKLKNIVTSYPGIQDIQTLLSDNKVSPDEYYSILREVLDLKSYNSARRTGYYVM